MIASTSRSLPPPILYALFFGASLLLALALMSVISGSGIDAAVFALIGHLWNDGALPYRDTFDNKPPMLFVLSALSDLVARMSGLDTIFTWRLTSALSVATIGTIFAIVLPASGVRRQSALVTGLLAVILLAFPAFSLGGGFSEPPAFALALVGMAIVGRGRGPLVIAGILSGLALATSFMALPLVAGSALLLVSSDRARSLRALLAFGAAIALTGLAFVALFAAAGALSDFLEAMVGYNRAYAAIACPIGGMVGWPCDPGWDRTGAIMTFGPVFVVAALIMLAGLWPGGPADQASRRRWLIVIMVAVAVSLPQVRRAPVDHYLWPMAVAMLFPMGAGIDRIQMALAAAPRRRAIGSVLGGMFILLLITWPLVSLSGWVMSNEARLADDRAAVVSLLDSRAPGDDLALWGGDTPLFFAADRTPAGGGQLLDIYPLLLPGFATGERYLEACRTLARLPVIVEDTQDLRLDGTSVPEGLPVAPMASIRALVAAHYEAPVVIGDYRVFLPTGEPAPGPDACASE